MIESISESDLSVTEYLGCEDHEAVLKRVFSSISIELGLSDKKYAGAVGEPADNMRDIKLAKKISESTQKTFDVKGIHSKIYYTDNIIKFELTNKMNVLKTKIKMKQKQQEERMLINKRAVLNMMIHKKKETKRIQTKLSLL
jgi:hypothetical protein